MSASPKRVPRLALSAGEPAGIGPELVVRAAQQPWEAQLIAFADSQLLRQASEQLGLPLTLSGFDPRAPARANQPGELFLANEPLPSPAHPGQLNIKHARYVLDALSRAGQACLNGDCDALVTAPLHKGVINDAGVAFTGHTEFLAELCGGCEVVMMLASKELRVCLVTTHLPLRQVADAITVESLTRTIEITREALIQRFGIPQPRIRVLGLNPHAGEQGHLGREEIEIMQPAIQALQARGFDLQGPTPADTGLTRDAIRDCDVVVAMYHDQGLPVLKHAGFGESVNITLGLPIIRTSVDHGTALDIAGKGVAEVGSLVAAMHMAREMALASMIHG